MEEFLSALLYNSGHLKKNSKEQVQRGNKNGEGDYKPIYQRLGKLNLMESDCLQVWCTMRKKGAPCKGDKLIEGHS